MSGIYLDYQATTPVDSRVAEVMVGVMRQVWGNPHSVEHRFGWEAEEVVERAQKEIAAVVGASAREIVFTSGATEANNLVFKGLAKALAQQGRRHVLVSAIEHACVLACADYLAELGFEVERIPVGRDGLVAVDAVKRLLRADTGLVSVMLVNNEIGTIQPVREIAELVHGVGALMHTDAAQGLGRVNLRGMGVDLMSLSAHKVYGPKGIGALYVRREVQALLEAQIVGGGQQHGLRSGTLAPMLCAGFGAAVRWGDLEREVDNERAADLIGQLEAALKAAGLAYEVQGSRERRIAQNINLRFVGVPTDALQMAMPEVAFSSGAACTTEGDKASHVLEAIGIERGAIDECFRLVVGRQTTEAEIAEVAQQLVEVLTSLRA